MGVMIRARRFGAFEARLEETVMGTAVSCCRYDGLNDRWEYMFTNWWGDDVEAAAENFDELRVALSWDAIVRRSGWGAVEE